MNYRLLVALAALLFFPAFTFAEEVKIQINTEPATEFYPFGEQYRGTASITANDLGEDGVEELIVGSGPGLPPLVKIFRQDGSLIREFPTYAETFKGGITIASCDVNGDGNQEIITGTMFSGGPHVRIFAADGTVLHNGGFFAYDGNFRGGVNVACGDIEGDGIAEIITGSGVTGGPHVKVFNADGELKHETFAGSASENTGATVAAVDVDGDGNKEVVAGRMGVGASSVIVFEVRENKLAYRSGFQAFEDEYTNGIHLSATDTNNDGREEIAVTTNRDANGRIKIVNADGTEQFTHTPFNNQKEKGIASTTLANGNLISLSTTARNYDQLGQYIYVDISEQRLYAYENGALVNSFLVSTGTTSFPTPLGVTDITAKLPTHNYTWFYGPGNPNNYNVPGVKWNLRFRQHYYIHSATWHNGFGTRRSHGCVNASVPDAEWIFNWANVGTTVEIAE